MSADFELYVEKYSKSYQMTPDEAVKHKLVQEVEKYYKEEEENANTKI